MLLTLPPLSQTVTPSHSPSPSSVTYFMDSPFVPIAFETLWPVNAEGAQFLLELGRRISSVSGDQSETNFLLQRLSICVQRHDAIALRGTFPAGREAWDEA